MTHVSPPSELQGYEDFVHTIMAEWKIPGVAVGIVKDGEVIFSKGFGKRNVSDDLDVTPQTIFALASCTKAFTAMGLAILVDEGKLNWDTPVRHYLPTFKLFDNVATERITPRDLLTHRTGLPGHDLVAMNSPISRKEVFDRLQYLEPNRDIRTTWQYNNLMYACAGYLLETISGQSWEDFTRERILEPLGMTSTSFFVQDVLQTSDYSQPYKLIDDDVQRVDFYARETAIGPAGSMNSNITDVTKWLLCLLNKGKYDNGQLVPEELFSQLIEPQMVMPSMFYQGERYLEESRYSYALGWWTFTYRGHTLVQHSGGIDGFSVLTTFLPDDNVGIVVLTNRQAHLVPLHGIFTLNICDRLLGLSEVPWNERTKGNLSKMQELVTKQRQENEADRIPDTFLSHPLSAYTGTFSHPAFGSFSLIEDGDGLKGYLNDCEYVFTHFHYNVFLVEQKSFDVYIRAAFSITLKGNIDSFSLPLEPAAKPIVFTRVHEASEKTA